MSYTNSQINITYVRNNEGEKKILTYIAYIFSGGYLIHSTSIFNPCYQIEVTIIH